TICAKHFPTTWSLRKLNCSKNQEVKMISKDDSRHGKMARASYGHFGRNEVAVLGTTCSEVSQLTAIIRDLFPDKEIAFADADHGDDDLPYPGLHFQHKKNGNHLSMSVTDNDYQRRMLFY